MARPTSHPCGTPALAHPFGMLDVAADLPRHQLAAFTASACAMFRGFEAIRHIQEQAAHRALARHQGALEQLRRPCRPLDLYAILADLVRFDAEGAVAYWQQIGFTAMETQAEMLNCCGELVDADKLVETVGELGGH